MFRLAFDIFSIYMFCFLLHSLHLLVLNLFYFIFFLLFRPNVVVFSVYNIFFYTDNNLITKWLLSFILVKRWVRYTVDSIRLQLMSNDCLLNTIFFFLCFVIFFFFLFHSKHKLNSKTETTKKQWIKKLSHRFQPRPIKFICLFAWSIT